MNSAHRWLIHLPDVPCPLCPSCTNPIGLTADPIPLSILAAPVDDLWPNEPHSGSHDSCRCGGPITLQLVTLINEEATCRVTEQGLGRERMDKEKRRRLEKGRREAVQWCVVKAEEARTRPNKTGLTLITLTQTRKKEKMEHAIISTSLMV